MSRSIGWKRRIGSSTPAIEWPSGLIPTVYRTRRLDGTPKSDRLLGGVLGDADFLPREDEVRVLDDLPVSFKDARVGVGVAVEALGDGREAVARLQ